MIVASHYSPLPWLAPDDPIYGPNGHIRRFLEDCVKSIDRYLIFTPAISEIQSLVPSAPGIEVYNVTDLGAALAGIKIDVWHDFGVNSPSQLLSLRESSGQNFSLSLDFTADVHLDVEPNEFRNLHFYDVTIYPSGSMRDIHECFIGSTRDPSLRHSKMKSEIICPKQQVPGKRLFSKHIARSRLGLDPEEVVILSYGTTRLAGVDFVPIANACHLASRHCDRLHIVFVGSFLTSADQMHSTNAPYRVTFVSDLTPEVTAMLFSAADFVISGTETWSTHAFHVVRYAMSQALPVITTAYTCSEDVLKHNISGFVLPLHSDALALANFAPVRPLINRDLDAILRAQVSFIDIKMLSEQISILSNQPAVRKRIGCGAAKNLKNFYRTMRPIESYVNLWTKLCVLRRGNQKKAASVQFIRFKQVKKLRSQTRLRLTSLGRRALMNGSIIVPTPLRAAIDAEVILQILALARRGISTAQLVESSAKSRDAATQQVAATKLRYHVCWCLKQGFLRLMNKALDS